MRHLVKRGSAGMDGIYGAIAAISGGSIIHTDKTNFSSALDYLSTAFLVSFALVLAFCFHDISAYTKGQCHLKVKVNVYLNND